jgi:hypothetical protein
MSVSPKRLLSELEEEKKEEQYEQAPSMARSIHRCEEFQ